MYHIIRPFHMCHSVVFRMFTELCNQEQVSFRIFHHPKKKLGAHSVIPPQQPLVCSLSVDLPVLGVTRSWSRAICGLL